MTPKKRTHIDLMAVDWFNGGYRLIRRTQLDDPDIGEQVRSGWATYVEINAPHTLEDCPFQRVANCYQRNC